jgi:hypothetical protein
MTLIIRDEQMAALRGDREDALVDRLLHRLVHEYPADYVQLGEAGAVARVRATVAAGVARGVRSEAGLASLLRLHVEFGGDLERAPHRAWARALLDHPGLPGELRVNLVSQRLSAATQGRRVVVHGEEA